MSHQPGPGQQIVYEGNGVYSGSGFTPREGSAPPAEGGRPWRKPGTWEANQDRWIAEVYSCVY